MDRRLPCPVVEGDGREGCVQLDRRRHLRWNSVYMNEKLPADILLEILELLFIAVIATAGIWTIMDIIFNPGKKPWWQRWFGIQEDPQPSSSISSGLASAIGVTIPMQSKLDPDRPQ